MQSREKISMNKKGNRLFKSSILEDKSSIVVSLRGSSNCSTNACNNFNKQKMQTNTKNSSNLKGKSSKKSDTILETTHEIGSTLLNNKTFKNRSKTRRKSKSSGRVKKKFVRSKRVFTPRYRRSNTLAMDFKSSSMIGNAKPKDRNKTRYNSLTNRRRNGIGDSVSTSKDLKNVFTLMPLPAVHFGKSCDVNRLKSNSDFLKKFSFIRGNSSFNQWENFSCFSEKETIFTVPKLSTSKPFLLKRKTYSCGILSVNDSGVSSSFSDNQDGKNEINGSLNHECYSNDTLYSSESSDNSESFEDKMFESKSPLKGTSILNIKEPIRVKYIDETTSQIRDLLIYSNEFLENIYKEKGSAMPKREVFDIIVKQCIDYKGKSLRIIRDAEEFANNLQKTDKNQPEMKTAKITKSYSPASSKKKMVQPQRRVKSAPSWIRWWGGTSITGGMGKWEMSEIKMHSSPRKDADTKNVQKHSKDILNREEGGRSETEKKATSTAGGKRVNFEEIIASGFRAYFQHYAKLGGRLKSGVVISRLNSHYWLKRSEMIFDDESFKIADDCFTITAKSKLVLNMSDYMQYLSAIARRRRMHVRDVIQKLISADIESKTKRQGELETK